MCKKCHASFNSVCCVCDVKFIMFMWTPKSLQLGVKVVDEKALVLKAMIF